MRQRVVAHALRLSSVLILEYWKDPFANELIERKHYVMEKETQAHSYYSW